MNVNGGSNNAPHTQPHAQPHAHPHHAQSHGHPQTHSHSHPHPHPQSHPSESISQTQCDFNFLKRKYESQVELPALGQDYDANPWKKRHLDYDVSGSGDMCFQLQLDTGNTTNSNSNSAAGSSFINDLFAYDNSLLVPAASYCAPPTGAPLEADAGGWQTGELLELDHRYNSGLQAEISQLNATLPPPPPPPPPAPTASVASSSSSTASFLVPIPQKPQPQSRRRNSESEPDFEDKNLSWLLNFKFDEFPHLSPDVGGGGQRLAGGLEAATPTAAANMASTSPCSSASPASASASASNSNHSSLNSNQSCHTTLLDQRDRSPKSCSTISVSASASTTTTTSTGGGTGAGTTTPTKTGRKFEELVMEVTSEMDANDMIVAEHVVVEDTTSKA